MLSVLRLRAYRHLFAAQVVALLGTGLATVALSLLAYDLAGDQAGAVLGTAFTIKMVAYVTLAPVASALAQSLPRRAWLVGLDLIRAAIALALPFVTEVWQIYVLIFLLQASSAGFTPVFQASIPDIVTDEEDYTNALSLSRLAYDLESLASPAIAAALLTVVPFSTLFFGTAAGFAASAMLVAKVALPALAPGPRRNIWERSTRGIRIYLHTPRLRGLLGLSFAAAATGAMVLVNTVVVIRSDLGLNENFVALALAAFGGGSMIAALALPAILRRSRDRRVMTIGASISVAAMFGAAALCAAAPSLPVILTAWALVGVGYSAVFTPAGRLLNRSVLATDRPAIFAAQFTLSHACWLITYPLAGWLMARFGLTVAMTLLPLLALAGIAGALWQWPRDTAPVPHAHPDLPPDHPHLQGGDQHAHVVEIDTLHPHFPLHPPR